MVYRYLLSNQSIIQCRICGRKLAELDIEGENQNTCTHCRSVDTCAPVKEFNEARRQIVEAGDL